MLIGGAALFGYVCGWVAAAAAGGGLVSGVRNAFVLVAASLGLLWHATALTPGIAGLVLGSAAWLIYRNTLRRTAERGGL